MTTNLERNPQSRADNPYAVGLDGSEWSRHEYCRSPVAMGAAVIAGIFGAALGAIMCWVVVKIFFQNTELAIVPVYASLLSTVLPGLVAVVTGILIGLRVNRRLNEQFRRVKEAEVKRAVMAEQMADYRSRLRQTRVSRQTTNP